MARPFARPTRVPASSQVILLSFSFLACLKVLCLRYFPSSNHTILCSKTHGETFPGCLLKLPYSMNGNLLNDNIVVHGLNYLKEIRIFSWVAWLDNLVLSLPVSQFEKKHSFATSVHYYQTSKPTTLTLRSFQQTYHKTKAELLVLVQIFYIFVLKPHNFSGNIKMKELKERGCIYEVSDTSHIRDTIFGFCEKLKINDKPVLFLR